jgi:hypothetical protein
VSAQRSPVRIGASKKVNEKGTTLTVTSIHMDATAQNADIE